VTVLSFDRQLHIGRAERQEETKWVSTLYYKVGFTCKL